MKQLKAYANMAASLAQSLRIMTETLPEPRERPASMPLVITGEMDIAQPHCDVFMVHHFCHRWDVHSSHHQTARRGVPHIMPREILKPSLRPTEFECRALGAAESISIATESHP